MTTGNVPVIAQVNKKAREVPSVPFQAAGRAVLLAPGEILEDELGDGGRRIMAISFCC